MINTNSTEIIQMTIEQWEGKKWEIEKPADLWKLEIKGYHLKHINQVLSVLPRAYIYYMN